MLRDVWLMNRWSDSWTGDLTLQAYVHRYTVHYSKPFFLQERSEWDNETDVDWIVDLYRKLTSRLYLLFIRHSRYYVWIIRQLTSAVMTFHFIFIIITWVLFRSIIRWALPTIGYCTTQPCMVNLKKWKNCCPRGLELVIEVW